MFPVQCEEIRINHRTPLLVVIMPYASWFLRHVDYIEDFHRHLRFQLGVAFWRVILREVYFEGSKTRIVFEGYWKIQSWTVVLRFHIEFLWMDDLKLNATKGHFTHEAEGPWPIHFKHSHWWRRWSRSRFASSHYAWGNNGVCKCKMDVVSIWHWVDHVSWSLGLFSKPTSWK